MKQPTVAQVVKILIVTAMHCEAAPIIARYSLKKVMDWSGPPLFASEGMTLIQSGIGRLKSAIATTRLLDREEDLSLVHAVNVGTCGSLAHPVGTPLVAHRVSDPQTGKNYIPDPIPGLKLPSARVVSVDAPALRPDLPADCPDCFDMEAGGFFEACYGRFSPHRISAFKVVSDALDISNLSKESIGQRIESALPALDQLLEAARALPFPPSLLDSSESTLLQEVSSALRLTRSQQLQLTDAAQCARGRGKEITALLNTYLSHITTDRSDRDAHHELLLAALNQ